MHGLELQWIEWIHQFRGPFLDALFRALTFFDRQEFIFVLLPIVWLNYGWKNGLRLFYILFINAITNSLLKSLFSSPRPPDLDPTIALIPIGGYGFPSGAAELTMLLSALFIYYQKNPLKWLLVIPYFFFVSFSRIYLGVHFITDVLGGWIVGFALCCIAVYLIPRIEKRLQNGNIYKLLSLHLFVIVALVYIFEFYREGAYLGCALGIAIGLWLSYKFKINLAPSKGVKEYLLRAVIGVLGVFTLYSFAFPSAFAGTFLSSVWLSCFAPLLLRQKLFLKKR